MTELTDGAGRRWVRAGLAVGVWAGMAGGVGWLAVRSAGPPAADLDLFDEPPVVRPPATPAAAVTLPDDARVIGVSAGGRFRAYPEAAFLPTFWHAVNDVVGGVPVTVTHCPRDGCTRVFVGPAGGPPLRLAVAGYAGGLVLRDGVERYRQATGRPLDGAGPGLRHPDAPFVRSTWGAWRAEHPDTDLVTGGLRRGG